MSRKESNVDEQNLSDTKYASGDSKRMNTKQQYVEENNNDVDKLSKEISEMGCIVDAVKRPPNICVETVVHNGNSDDDYYEDYEEEPDGNENDNEEEGYSDAFEECSSDNDVEKEINKNEGKDEAAPSFVKLSKSQLSTSSKFPASSSGRSTSFGSVSVPQTRRVNMSFSNDRLRDIERHNHILLTKILSARNKKSSIPPRDQQPVKALTPSAALHRKNQQRKIDHENLILLKKIQRAKSSACSIRR